MKKWFLNLILLSIISFSAIANSKFDISSPQSVSNRTPDTKVLGKINDAHFIMRYNFNNMRRGIELERYNSQMRLNAKSEFLSSRNTHFVKALLTQKSIVAFYIIYDRRDNKASINAKVINNNLVSIIDNEIFEIYAGSLQDAVNRLNFEVSKDRNYLLVYYQDPNQPSIFHYFHYQPNLELNSKGAFNLNINTKFNINQTFFNQDHIAFLINTDKKSKDLPDTFLTVHLYELETKELKEYALNKDSLYAISGILKFDYINNKLNFTGVYHNSSSDKNEGFVVYNINLDQTDSVNSSFFNVNELNLYIKDGGSLPRTSMNNFYIKDVIITSIGGILLISEFYEVSQRLYQDFPAYGVNQTYVRNHYLYQEVLIISFDKNMDVEWTQLIKKDQNSVNDKGIYSSFSLSILPRELRFIFNDMSRINWNILEVTIDLSGNMNRNVLVNNLEFDGRLIPKLGVQISSNEAIIPGYLHRRGHVTIMVTH